MSKASTVFAVAGLGLVAVAYGYASRNSAPSNSLIGKAVYAIGEAICPITPGHRFFDFSSFHEASQSVTNGTFTLCGPSQNAREAAMNKRIYGDLPKQFPALKTN